MTNLTASDAKFRQDLARVAVAMEQFGREIERLKAAIPVVAIERFLHEIEALQDSRNPDRDSAFPASNSQFPSSSL